MFLIIEDLKSKKFVQFACGETEGLGFDLPPQALNKDEFELAREKMENMEQSVNHGLYGPDGKLVDAQDGR